MLQQEKNLSDSIHPSQEFIKHVTFDATGKHILAIGNWRLLYVWDVATGELVARGSKTDNGILFTTPDGLFDGPDKTSDEVYYRVGHGLNVVPVDRFYKDLRYPGLMPAILRGERPLPAVDVGGELPPTLRIVSHKSDTVEEREAVIVAEAMDQGGGVSEFHIYQNGSRVISHANEVRDGKTLRRTFKLQLVEGENKIEGPRCRQGRLVGKASRRALHCNTINLCPAPSCIWWPWGVNNYADKAMNLTYAAADAKAISELFQTRGEALYGKGKVHVRQLLDEQATRHGIVTALEQVAAEAKSQDSLVLLLSGHGTMIGQQYYFLPHDVKTRCRQAGRRRDPRTRPAWQPHRRVGRRHPGLASGIDLRHLPVGRSHRPGPNL